MSNPYDREEQLRRVKEDMETMRAAVKEAQAACLARGVPIAYSIGGVMHWEYPNGEITRDNPWKDKDLPKSN